MLSNHCAAAAIRSDCANNLKGPTANFTNLNTLFNASPTLVNPIANVAIPPITPFIGVGNAWKPLAKPSRT